MDTTPLTDQEGTALAHAKTNINDHSQASWNNKEIPPFKLDESSSHLLLKTN